RLVSSWGSTGWSVRGPGIGVGARRRSSTESLCWDRHIAYDCRDRLRSHFWDQSPDPPVDERRPSSPPPGRTEPMPWIAPILMAVPIAASAPTYEEVVWTGRVVMMTETLDAYEVSVDSGPIAEQVVLEREDGRVVPLLSDPASRALFEDERLRSRPI